MREYLFRGKRLDNGEWVYGYGAIDNEILTLDFAKGIVRVECVPETVGQFTGLTDKNGRKIFEGDVLSYSNPKPFRDFIAVVSFNDGCFDLVNDSRDYRDYLKCHTCNYTGNVIGNSWDNPELLEGVG